MAAQRSSLRGSKYELRLDSPQLICRARAPLTTPPSHCRAAEREDLMGVPQVDFELVYLEKLAERCKGDAEAEPELDDP